MKLPTREIELGSQNNNGKSFKKEPVHEISNNVVCATSKASDQPAHTQSDQSPC